MYSIRYNPILPVGAAVISIISINKIMRMTTAPPASFNHPSLLVFQGLILILSLVALIMLLVRKHIVATEEVLHIRENCMRTPKEINIQDIKEVRWGVNDSSVWNKGKKQFTVSMKNGEDVNFFSMAWLPNRERIQFFDYLKGKGLRVIE
ncbi:MAG: hypothetical protein PHH28_12680 [Desulfuromonadaceae bacterium]|nr:hypothetical protein [Desulfuromonadaceae bacterium]